MAYVIGSDEYQKELIESLQCGDYVLLLGQVFKWEREDFGNDYGGDVQVIPLLATIMAVNGYIFDTSRLGCAMKRAYDNGIEVSWDPKTRNLTYTHGTFKGGIEKVDTVDKIQRVLRTIGLKEYADNFEPTELSL